MKKNSYFIQGLWLISLAFNVFAEDIRDIKPPVYFAPNQAFIFFLLAIALIALAIFFVNRFLKKRRQKTKEVDESFLRSPHEIAYEALEKLKAKNLPGRGLIKEYYSELSGIVRYYLEGRFGFRAPEMTTEEFLQALRNSGYLNGAQKNLLKNFLTHCDLVKFAKYGPSQSEITESFYAAHKLVDETKTEQPRPNEQGQQP